MRCFLSVEFILTKHSQKHCLQEMNMKLTKITLTGLRAGIVLTLCSTIAYAEDSHLSGDMERHAPTASAGCAPPCSAPMTVSSPRLVS